MYVFSLTQQYIFIILLATSFGHAGYHQANVSQKPKKAGTYNAKSLIYMGSHLQSLTALKLLTAVNNFKDAVTASNIVKIYCCVRLTTYISLFYRCIFSVRVQFFRPQPPGRNPIEVNKYHIISNTLLRFL